MDLANGPLKAGTSEQAPGSQRMGVSLTVVGGAYLPRGALGLELELSTHKDHLGTLRWSKALWNPGGRNVNPASSTSFSQK